MESLPLFLAIFKGIMRNLTGPSRASMLSGRRPDKTQMWNFVGGFRTTPGAEKWNTWMEYFKNHGYYTAGAGKLFHPGDPADFDPRSWTEPKCNGVEAKFPYHGQTGSGFSCPKVPDGRNLKKRATTPPPPVS